MDILPRMMSPVSSLPHASATEAWLAALPRKIVRAATEALQHLPTDMEAAGTELPLVIAAWSRADPARAAQLLEQWLATADPQGHLSPSCVTVCQLADWIADSLPAPDPFLGRILPGLARCVEGNAERYDQKGTGLPLWQTKDEAWFPSEYAPGRFTVDLAALLSNEAAAFCRLAEGHPEVDAAANDAEGEQRDLDGWLQDQFWNEEESLFYRYEGEGQSLPDHSLCGLIPLVWSSRTREVTEGIRPRAKEWNRADWPPRTWILFFAMLLHTPHHGVLTQMRSAGLPEGASEIESAVWTVLLADSERRQLQVRGELSAPVRWLDIHGRLLRRSLVTGGILLLVGLIGWQVFHRESAGTLDVNQLERRARQACDEGQHGRAAALYGKASQKGQSVYFRYRQAGEWLHMGEPAEAEKAYCALLREEPESPNIQINLALAILRQERREEALEIYRRFANEYGEYPELAARARLAAELIERQQSLDQSAGSGIR